MTQAEPTVVDMLRRVCLRQPNRTAVRVLDNEAVLELTYGELDQRARGLAAILQDRRLQGERAIIIDPAGLDYAVHFFACLYAGVIAVPSYPLTRSRRSSVHDRFQAMVVDSGARVALSSKTQVEMPHEAPHASGLMWISDEHAGTGDPDHWRRPELDAGTTAFLQYTSGSTTSPRGVVVSHANLLEQSSLIEYVRPSEPQDCFLSWLPLYHDMGLIAFLIHPLLLGCTATIMPTATFIRRPVRWIETISRYRVRFIGSTNFGYDYCAANVTEEQKANLDLSSVDIAAVSADLVREESLLRFETAFASCGFRGGSLLAVYGLAEATLGVTGNRCGTGRSSKLIRSSALGAGMVVDADVDAPDTRRIMSCGAPAPRHSVRIVNPDTCCAATKGSVGEIWVSGPCVAGGYWQNEIETERVFRARLADTGEGPYLRTGDLGFMHDGELYVVGRFKDLIIVRGRNVFGHDIEATVCGVNPALRLDSTVAIGVEERGEERLVILIEMDRSASLDFEAVARAVRKAVLEVHGLAVDSIVAVKPRSIPRTTSGKLQRHLCRQAYASNTFHVIARWSLDAERAQDKPLQPLDARIERVTRLLLDIISRTVPIALEAISPKTEWIELGLDSIKVVQLAESVRSRTGVPLEPAQLLDLETVEQVAEHLIRNHGRELDEVCVAKPAETAQSREQSRDLPSSVPAIHRSDASDNHDIAVIGMACRIPQASNPDEFWRILRDGRCVIGETPAERWDWRSFSEREGSASVRWGGFLSNVEQFDAEFFGIPDGDAVLIDPQQRLFLEVVWESIERAGYKPSALAGSRTGVFVGVSAHEYADLLSAVNGYSGSAAITGNSHAFLANRVSYLFDFHGPSLAIDTACSSSLVAAHLAVQSLRRGECCAAIVGGVNLILSPETSFVLGRSGLLADDGACRAFDERAGGYVRGEAVAALLLKPLREAERDGDEIVAVIKGSAVGHDGNHKIGLTAPSPRGQYRVAMDALRDARTSAATIGLVEAHGTGTPLGDGIELQGLQRAFSEMTGRKAFCALGSVKTRVGHSEAASGITSIIATALAFQNGEIPPSLDMDVPSRQSVVENSPFYLNERRRTWSRGESPRRAAVNSVGFGGVGAHVVLEEAPVRAAPHRAFDGMPYVLTVSARSETALLESVRRYRTAVEQIDSVRLHEACATANRGRKAFRHRVAIVATSREQLLGALHSIEQGGHGDGAVVFRGDAAPVEGAAPYEEIIALLDALDKTDRQQVLACWRDPIVDTMIRPRLTSAVQNSPADSTRGAPSQAVMVCFAAIFAHGADIDWGYAYDGWPRYGSALPTYPFERRRYWPERETVEGIETAAPQPRRRIVNREDALEELLLNGLAAAAPDTATELDPETNFLDLGINSIAATRLTFILEQMLNVRISVIDLFEYPNIRALARFLAPKVKEIPSESALEALRAPTVARSPIEPFASTPLQEAYLMARALPRSMGGGASQVTVDLEIPGDLDRGRLQQSLLRLVNRHPMLRTVFLKDGRQRILEEIGDIAIEVRDLRELGATERATEYESLHAAAAGRAFDPLAWPLFSAQAVVLESGSFHLLFGIDLLLVDFHSLTILLREWRAFYTEPDKSFEPLPIDFSGYMAAMLQLRASERYEADRQWWKARVADFPPPPAICRPNASFGKQRAAFRTLQFVIPPETWERACGQATRRNVSISMLLCGALCRTLQRWSGSTEFSLNLPIFDRYPVHPSIDGVVGPFNNNVLLGVKWPSDGDTWATVRQLQSDCLEALEHRLFAGVEFAREVAKHRKSLTDPIGSVVFTPAIHGTGLVGWGKVCQSTSETPQVWLDCQVIGAEGGATVRWDYDPALFEQSMIDTMFADFQTSIAWMTDGAAVRETVVPEEVVAEPTGPTLDSIFSEQAARTPRLRAVACNGKYKTYAALEQRANQIGQALLARGVQAGSLVAIVAERGIEMVEAVLGVLKAGCAYVPIDPEYPAKRVEYLLEHSQARIVLTHARLMAGLPKACPPLLDITGAEVDSMPVDAPARKRSPEDLAYVIYTSGSTGTPKGVMISHAAAINTIVDINERFGITKFDRVLGFSSLSFDLSVYDLFGTLSAGATLVILPRESLKSPDRWMDLIRREGVTIWNSVPTGMKMLLDFCEGRRNGAAPTLRLVMLSGDWIPLDLPGRILAFFDESEVVSLGGATEGAIWSIFYPVRAVRPEWKTIPYGAALSNQSWHVLDDDLQRVPRGEVGELCIGGKGVAMGYYRDPERTARSFVRDPNNGEMLYRTGDLGRVMDDGNIEILGRRDLQVKIRGFRVELGEIEAALNNHPGVDSGVVTVRGDRGKHELAAHYVPRSDTLTAADLRAHLRSVLPDYMVPQHFVEHRSLPLNANGKIDRGVLDVAII